MEKGVLLKHNYWKYGKFRNIPLCLKNPYWELYQQKLVVRHCSCFVDDYCCFGHSNSPT